tara:strand:- start:52 stop:318 length:267 start_codon:yes stop_codon:yes gene_type:complete
MINKLSSFNFHLLFTIYIYFFKIVFNREKIMCVVCNLTNQGYETAYLAVQNESTDTVIVPVVNRLLELHSYQIIDSMLIQASLIGIIL